MIAEETRGIIDVCQKFAARRIGPKALEADLNGSREWLLSIWKEGNDIGLTKLLIPEEQGGIWQSDSCCGLVLDTLSSECSGAASLFLHHYAACRAILAAGESGYPFFSSILPNDGGQPPIATVIFPSDMDEKRLVVKEEGGRLLLRGTSPLVGNVTLARFFLVFAYEEEGGNDLTCIFIERESPIIQTGPEADLPGLKINPFASLIFQDAEITSDLIVGKRGEAGEIYRKVLDSYHGFIAACGMGAARSAYRSAFNYAKDRYQFGDLIIYHGEIQKMLGNMLAKLSVGTSSYMASLNGESYGMVHGMPRNRFSKIFCTDAALEIAIDAVQIHGGYGYMHDYGVEKIMRDVKVLQLLGESNPVISIKTIQELHAHDFRG